MPNIASLLKAEIARVARKEVRAETQALRKAVTAHRSQIASLRRQVRTLEQALGQARRSIASSQRGAAAAAPADDNVPTVQRFSAKGFATARRRLELSAADLGLLFGVSGQTIYHWESGKARPRARHMPAIAALRTIGKRAVMAHLASLKAGRSGSRKQRRA
jgi:DNA-binding transcriptional regulator YiaG